MSNSSAHVDVRTLQQFIAGRWCASTTAETLDTRNPSTGDLLARVPRGTEADVDAAVRAAISAQRGWARTAPQVRARALYRLRDVLDAHRDELADLVVQDMGKTRDDARAEVGRGIESVEAAMGAPHLLKGQTMEGIGRGVDVELHRQPVGIVGAITPFNFPVMIPLWFLPFALVSGNGVVLKPSEQDPLAAERIIELVATVDEIPRGLVALVHGDHAAVNAILDHPGVDAVSFVGSAATARYVATRATEHGKRVQALGGAKNAMVIMPDADHALMASQVVGSAFGAAGQRCMAGSIAVLVGSRDEQDRSLKRIVDAANELVCGAADDPVTDVCPVISRASRERLVAAIDGGERDGVTVVLDGRRTNLGAGRSNLGPTILDGVPADHAVATDELFGPVLAVIRVADLDEALEFVNAGRYGNSAILFSESGGAARRFRVEAMAGMLGVNVGVAAPIAWLPFAGWKASIDADLGANGDDAFRFYTRAKVVTSRWGSEGRVGAPPAVAPAGGMRF